MRSLKYFLLFSAFFFFLLTIVFILNHERAHAKVSQYFGYPSGAVVLTAKAISTPTYIPVVELNTPKYYAYLSAQSAVDAVGYQLMAFIPFISLLLGGVFTWLMEKTFAR